MEPETVCEPMVVNRKENTVEKILKTFGMDFEWSAYGVAPHFLKLVDSAVMAVNGYCVAQAFRFEGVPYFRRRDHRVSFGNVKVPVYAEVATTEFLSSLRLTYAYNISVVQPFGPDGKFSLFTVLLACWKLAEVAERDSLQNYGPTNFLHAATVVFEMFRLDKFPLRALQNASEDEIGNHIHFIYFNKTVPKPDSEEPADDTEKASLKISGLRQKYDIVYLKTDLHFCLNSPFRPYGEPDVGEGLRSAIEDEMKPNYDGEALAEHLLNEFMKREARNECSDMEAICANAFEKIYEEDGRRFAFDSHIGGIVLFLAKGEYEERTILKRIANVIFELSEESHLIVEFRPMSRPVGAMSPANRFAELWGDQEYTQFHYRKAAKKVQEVVAEVEEVVAEPEVDAAPESDPAPTPAEEVPEEVQEEHREEVQEEVQEEPQGVQEERREELQEPEDTNEERMEQEEGNRSSEENNEHHENVENIENQEIDEEVEDQEVEEDQEEVEGQEEVEDQEVEEEERMSEGPDEASLEQDDPAKKEREEAENAQEEEEETPAEE